MKNAMVLSKAEMKNVMGGIIDGDTLYETCKTWIGGRTYDYSDEDAILERLIEVHCSNFTFYIP